jgi:hypothetical protein
MKLTVSVLLFAHAFAMSVKFHECFGKFQTNKDCIAAEKIFNTATTLANQLIGDGTFPAGSLTQGAARAFQHCYWTGAMTMSLGLHQVK